MTIDTSTEHVKAMTFGLRRLHREWIVRRAADLIEALAAERDAQREKIAILKSAHGSNARIRRRIRRVNNYDPDKAVQALLERDYARKTEIDALRAENEVLKRALEPFAKVAECDIGKDEGDDEQFMPFQSGHNRAPKLLVGDLRAAKAALSTKEPNL